MTDPRPSDTAENGTARKAQPKTLYVHRKLLNAEQVISWAKANGFETTLPDYDLHTTIVYSKEAMDWDALKPSFSHVTVRGGERSLHQFGEATVLTFESNALHTRWAEALAAGASYDYPEYRPHVTLSYNATELDLSAIVAYDGPLVFGPEVFAEVNPGWSDRLAEKGDAEASTRHVAIKKIDHDEQVVYGEVYAPYVLDAHGEFMLPEDIELMAHRFMKLELGTSIDTHHDNVPNGSYPIESFIARDSDPDYTPGAWVLGVKVPDPFIWQQVRDGKLNGFSFQSLVKATEVEIDYTVYRDVFGETELHDDHTHTYFVQVDDMGRVLRGHTDEVNGHSHEIVRASFTKEADGHSHRFFL